MKITKIPGCGSQGVFIDDLDFTTITDDEWMEVGRIHLRELITIIRNVKLDERSYLKWARMLGRDRLNWGRLMWARYPQANGNVYKLLKDPSLSDADRRVLKEYFRIRVGGIKSRHGDMLKVSGIRDKNGNRIGMFADGELTWHSNESGDICFTPNVCLLGVKGMTKSATGFQTTTDYYYSLPDSFRSELDEMVLVHNFKPYAINPGLNEEQDAFIMNMNICHDPDVEIPMVIQSPGGVKGLHYSYNSVTHIKGMSEHDSELILSQIRKDLEKYSWDYWWENDNDLILFDNTILQHRRLGDTTDRMAYRYAHDLDEVGGEYIPYFQEEYIERYKKRKALLDEL